MRKKPLKCAIALVLAIVLVLSMSTSAFAMEDGCTGIEKGIEPINGNDILYASGSPFLAAAVTYPSVPGNSVDGSFELSGLPISVEATLFCAMLSTGLGVSVAVGIITAAVGMGLSRIYFHYDNYYAADDKYQYVKTVLQCYTDSAHTKKLGSKTTWERKRDLDAHSFEVVM